jgi:hypothetical protein
MNVFGDNVIKTVEMVEMVEIVEVETVEVEMVQMVSEPAGLLSCDWGRGEARGRGQVEVSKCQLSTVNCQNDIVNYDFGDLYKDFSRYVRDIFPKMKGYIIYI